MPRKIRVDSIGDVAGDYRGSHKAPDLDFGSPLNDLEDMMPDIYSRMGERYYGFGDPVIDRESFDALRRAQGKPDLPIPVYRAVPEGVSELNVGDWVSTSEQYARNHGESVFDGKFDIIEAEVPAGKLQSEGDPREFGVLRALGNILGIGGVVALAGQPREAQAQGILEMLLPPQAEAFRVQGAGAGSDMPMTDEQYNEMVRMLNAR